MRENLYTCCRCGQEVRVTAASNDPPLGWALVTFCCYTTDDLTQTILTTLTTHACWSCSTEVLAFLEKAGPPNKEVDRAIDDGDAA